MANKTVAKVYPFCKRITWVSVPVEASEACPDGSATARETLISGICPKCQRRIFEENEPG